MIGYFFQIASLVLARAVATSADFYAGVLSEADKAELLDDHNKFRSVTALGRTGSQPGATNMLKLEWDEALAVSSKVHADKCNFQHSTGRGYGENLAAAASSSGLSFSNLKNGIVNWYNEHTDYNFDPNTCSGVCGHYTQVVWANSDKVGCAYQSCQDGDIFSGYAYQLILVCQYSPPGNFNGQKPYQRTTSQNGIASACPQGTVPEPRTGLCAMSSGTPPTEAPSQAPSQAPTRSADCSDSPLKFKIVLSNGKKKKKYCAFISENTNSHCALTGAEATCPFTCGTCDRCVNSPGPLNIEKSNGVMVWKKCKWVKKNKAVRCLLPGVMSSCRKICGDCAPE